MQQQKSPHLCRPWIKEIVPITRANYLKYLCFTSRCIIKVYFTSESQNWWKRAILLTVFLKNLNISPLKTWKKFPLNNLFFFIKYISQVIKPLSKTWIATVSIQLLYKCISHCFFLSFKQLLQLSPPPPPFPNFVCILSMS